MMDSSHFRVVFMGAAGVGKTSIICRLLYNTFPSEYRATVEDFHKGSIVADKHPLDLDIIDTTGAYSFPAMRRLGIQTGDAFVLVYSLGDDGASFEEVKNIHQQILEEKATSCVPIVIVGNKRDVMDATQAIKKVIAETTALMDWENGYVECSAKEDRNLSCVFEELLGQIRRAQIRRRREIA